MIGLIPVVVVVSVLMAFPGWAYARRRQGASWLLLFLSIPATLAWSVLFWFPVNRVGLGNLLFEPPLLIPIATLFVYVQVFLLDRWLPNRALTTQSLAVALVAFATGLRLFMPAIQE